jgi:hypothetical protein
LPNTVGHAQKCGAYYSQQLNKSLDTTQPGEGATMARSFASRAGSRTLLACALTWIASIITASLASAQAVWEFGAQRLMVTAESAAPLVERAFGAAGLASMGVLTRVGGVNIEGVAAFNPPVATADFAIHYNPANSDGKRLEIKAWGTTYTFNLPDWELKPLALLADSNYTADVSLFGDGPDRDHYFYIQYHPALKDTLLGLRILQADMMLIDPKDLSKAPKWNGRVVLGLGEQLPSADKSVAAATEIIKMTELYPIQSWVLTDINAQTVVEKSGTTISINAHPYYYFWTSSENRLHWQYDLLKEFEKRVSDETEKTKIESRLQEILDEAEKLISAPQGSAPEALTEITTKLQKREQLLADLNPLVWHVVVDTAKYSAIFRYIKQHDPTDWAAFARQVRAIAISPAVKTPTEWKRPE